MRSTYMAAVAFSRLGLFALAIFLLLALSCAAPADKPAVYYGSYSALPSANMPPSDFGIQSLYMSRIDVVTNGNDFTGDLYINNAPNVQFQKYAVQGSFGCANGKLSVALKNMPNSCVAIPPPSQGRSLCDTYIPQYCTGDFSYSTYRDPDGTYHLQITDWCGMSDDVVLVCVGDSCGGFVQCSSSISNVVIQGGSVITNDSVIIIDGGPTVIQANSTPVYIDQSRNFTIDSSATNLTLQLNYSTTIVNTQANNTYLNTGPLRTCTGWLDYTPTTGSNVTLSDTPAFLSFASAQFASGDGTATWNLPSSATVKYVSSLNGASYMFSYCLQSASVFVPSGIVQEERVTFALLNVTSGSPVALAPSVSTSIAPRGINGSRAMLNSACGTFVTDQVRQNDLYGFYISSAFVAGSGSSLVLAPDAVFSLSIIPTGCSGNINNITFNITVQFANGTLIKPGYYINITTDQQDGSFRINNEGLVLVRPNTTGEFPAQCLYGTKDSLGVLDLRYSGVCAVAANSGTPHGGAITLRSTASVSVNDLGGGEFSFNATELTFSGDKCVGLGRTAKNVAASFSGLCSVQTSSTCLAVSTNGNGNATITFEVRGAATNS